MTLGTGIIPVGAISDSANDLRYDEYLVYRFLNGRAETIYIGITGTPRTRWQAHLRRQAWAREIAEIYYTAGMTKPQALNLEREAILDERPIYNRTVSHAHPLNQA